MMGSRPEAIRSLLVKHAFFIEGFKQVWLQCKNIEKTNKSVMGPVSWVEGGSTKSDQGRLPSNIRMVSAGQRSLCVQYNAISLAS